MSKKYICPKCGSDDTYKEKIMGADTGDRICKSCGYTTSGNSFKTKEEAMPDKK
ncbi:TFIIB-type zinc ribbon-containing protein [Alteromonas stellipolaris]|uniref:TFIIB-type zinc ribbon-containing protein n=1 Tax=Alteromonas stellipolaris TaxID=233316 RepID=UPI000A63C6A0|nr:TFIIB-type zinc ribbon-containing protein [Alteromonas stellipolaris]